MVLLHKKREKKNKIFEFIINSIFFVKIERGGTH